MTESQAYHLLNGHIHNISELLKVIKDEAVIENEDTKSILDIVIEREKSVMEALEVIGRERK